MSNRTIPGTNIPTTNIPTGADFSNPADVSHNIHDAITVDTSIDDNAAADAAAAILAGATLAQKDYQRGMTVEELAAEARRDLEEMEELRATRERNQAIIDAENRDDATAMVLEDIDRAIRGDKPRHAAFGIEDNGTIIITIPIDSIIEWGRLQAILDGASHYSAILTSRIRLHGHVTLNNGDRNVKLVASDRSIKPF
ncbi:MAG: hypothetical protein QM519_02370 [Bacteroidia bacterium]|nr:hypothetical protein [Bacteroidia bacterium]